MYQGLEVLRQLRTAGVAGVHRDPRANGVLEVDLLLLEDEARLVGADALEDGAVLAGDDGEHLDGDAVELVEAAPRAGLHETAENHPHRFVI